jgi:hypothetical protein
MTTQQQSSSTTTTTDANKVIVDDDPNGPIWLSEEYDAKYVTFFRIFKFF